MEDEKNQLNLNIKLLTEMNQKEIDRLNAEIDDLHYIVEEQAREYGAPQGQQQVGDIYQDKNPHLVDGDEAKAVKINCYNKEELEKMKIHNFKCFLKDKIKWTNRLIGPHETAASHGLTVWKTFRTWCTDSKKIYQGEKFCKNIPQKPEFFRLLKEENEKHYPDEWDQSNKYRFPKNGIKTGPRFNLVIKSD